MKTSNYIKLLLSLVFILFSSFCCIEVDDFPEYNKVEHVVVVNQTDEVILVHANVFNNGELKWLFSHGDNSKFISPGEADKVDFYIFRENGSSHRSPLWLFIIKKETLDKYTITEIFERNIYDEKLSFSFDELFESHFRINYK